MLATSPWAIATVGHIEDGFMTQDPSPPFPYFLRGSPLLLSPALNSLSDCVVDSLLVSAKKPASSLVSKQLRPFLTSPCSANAAEIVAAQLRRNGSSSSGDGAENA